MYEFFFTLLVAYFVVLLILYVPRAQKRPVENEITYYICEPMVIAMVLTIISYI